MLHPGIAVAWWLPDHPAAGLAGRFRTERLLTAQVGLDVVEGIEDQVLAQAAGAESRRPPEQGFALVDDIYQTFQSMIQLKILNVVSRRLLMRRAFALAGYYNLPYFDMLSVALARGFETPLLLIDEQLYRQLLAIELANVTPILLQDYLR